MSITFHRITYENIQRNAIENLYKVPCALRLALNGKMAISDTKTTSQLPLFNNSDSFEDHRHSQVSRHINRSISIGQLRPNAHQYAERETIEESSIIRIIFLQHVSNDQENRKLK